MRRYVSRRAWFVGVLLVGLLVAPARALPAETVYFSAITLYHPIVMYEKYQPLMDYLSAKTPYRFELKLTQNYRDVIELLKSRTVQVALLGGVTYLDAKEEFDVVPILKPFGASRKPFYRSAIVVRQASAGIRSLSDLKGKSFAFASEHSTSGHLAPIHHLYKRGIRLQDLKRHEHLRYHDSVAREVLRGNFDAGAVIDSVAEQFKKKGLKVLDFTEPIPGLPFVVRADAPRALVDAIEKALLALDYDRPEDREVLAQWDEEFRFGFTAATDADYDVIRSMIADCNRWKVCR